MNSVLSGICQTKTPNFNKKITEGTAQTLLRSAPEYLNEIIQSSMRSVNPEIGLVYHGWRRVTPKEQFIEMYEGRETKAVFDTAISDLYMIELRFTYKGKPIHRHLLLPYCGKGNLLRISNTVYHIVPVLSDTVISPNYKEVFVRLLKDKLLFRRVDRNFIINGERSIGQIIYSSIYRIMGRDINDNLGNIEPPLSLYILGEYGFHGAMERYLGIKDYIITLDDVSAYRKTHHIYESTKLKPRQLKEYNYKGHDLKILIPKTHERTALLDNFIFGLIYTFDVFPDKVTDFIDVLENHDLIDEQIMWRVLLGRIIFKDGYSISRIITDMNEHFNTLQSYLDNLIKRKLIEAGMKVDNFFDLLAVILDNYNTWLLNSKEYNSNLDNRYIDILYYILYEIILGINRTLLDISRKSLKKVLSEPEVSRIFTSNLSIRKIFKVVKSSGVNLALLVADSSSDLMYPKITSTLEDQSRGRGVERGSATEFPESTRTLKAQDIQIGSILFLGKKAPSPRFKANPFMDYDTYTGKIYTPEHVTRWSAKLDDLLRGKVSDDSIIMDEIIEDDDIDGID